MTWSAARMTSELRAAWAIARKDITTYYIKPNIIMAGLLFPVFMFLAFASGRGSPSGTLIPGLIAITLLFSASTIEPVSIPIERRMKTFDRLLSAPISISTIVLGESISGFLYSIGIALLPILIGAILFPSPILHPLWLVLSIMLTAFLFATMGTLFASYPTENVGEVMSILNVVRLPLIFISGVFIPISSMPPIGQSVALFSPLTYANDLIRFGYAGDAQFNPWASLAGL
ncbi:MAG: ABC transporter permease, partial [Methanomicrobiales archaeon]|nr:ABC transporter permease [Methanomicrobiales archaeon]